MWSKYDYIASISPKCTEGFLKVFPDLNKKERNIILRHMWPLTIIPPRYKEAWIVQYCDKKATFHDYFSKKKKIKK